MMSEDKTMETGQTADASFDGEDAAPQNRQGDVAAGGGEPPAPASQAATAAPDAADRSAPPSVAEGGTPVEGSALSQEELDRLTEDVIAALKTVHDPEIPADIYELGLIYRIDIADDRAVTVDMTLTAPGCPVAGEMPVWVENAVSSVQGVGPVTVNLTFDPPWDMGRMSDEARLAIGIF